MQFLLADAFVYFYTIACIIMNTIKSREPFFVFTLTCITFLGFPLIMTRYYPLDHCNTDHIYIYTLIHLILHVLTHENPNIGSNSARS